MSTSEYADIRDMVDRNPTWTRILSLGGGMGLLIDALLGGDGGASRRPALTLHLVDPNPDACRAVRTLLRTAPAIERRVAVYETTAQRFVDAAPPSAAYDCIIDDAFTHRGKVMALLQPAFLRAAARLLSGGHARYAVNGHPPHALVVIAACGSAGLLWCAPARGRAAHDGPAVLWFAADGPSRPIK